MNTIIPYQIITPLLFHKSSLPHQQDCNQLFRLFGHHCYRIHLVLISKSYLFILLYQPINCQEFRCLTMGRFSLDLGLKLNLKAFMNSLDFTIDLCYEDNYWKRYFLEINKQHELMGHFDSLQVHLVSCFLSLSNDQ